MIECAVFWFQSCSRVFLPMAILVSVLWLIETRVKILQPHHRAWMWRLFFVKCLVATLLPWFVVVPWLPSMPSGHALVELSTEQHGWVQADDSFDIHSMGPVAVSASAVESDFKRLTEPASQAKGEVGKLIVGQSVILGLFIAWVVLVAVQLSMLLANYSQLIAGLKRGKVTVDLELVSLYRTLAMQLGVRNAPALRVLMGLKGPAFVFDGKATILLPSHFKERHGIESCKMAIAHELAHYQRGDIYWNLIATCVSLTFFYFPPVWLAMRRYRIAMESACDAFVVRQASMDCSKYANLLVSLIEPKVSKLSPVFVGMARSESFLTLSERLHAMNDVLVSPRRKAASLCMLGLMFVCMLAPWGTADENDAPRKKSARSSRPPLTTPKRYEEPAQPVGGVVASASGVAHSSGGGVQGAASNAQVHVSPFPMQTSNGQGFSGGSASSGGFSSGNGLSSGIRSFNGMGRASGGGFAAAGGSASGTASSQAGGAQMLPPLGDSGFGDMPRMPLGFGPQVFANGRQGDQVSVSKSTRSDEEGAVTIVNVLTKTEEVSIRSSESEGVEVRVRKLSKATKSERETGKRRSKETVYESDSIEAFEKEHPEIYPWVQKYLLNDSQLANAGVVVGGGGFGAAAGGGANPAEQLLKQQVDELLKQQPNDPGLESLKQQLNR